MVIPNLRNKLPPLGSLAAFEAASRHGSFTKAAEELNLTQAAISRQILALEEHLVARLFDRLRHNVVLTPQGKRFAEKVNPALFAICDAATAIKSGFTNELAIRSEFCLAAHWLMPRLSRFQALHPTLSLKVMTSNRAVETEQEHFDVALGYGASNSPTLKSTKLVTDFMVPICSPSVRARLPEKCDASDLADFDLIHFEQRGSDWLNWQQFLNQFDVTLGNSPRFALSMYNSVIDAALQGYGVALGWRCTVDRLLTEGQLVEISELAIRYPSPLCAHVPVSGHPPEPLADFIAWVHSEITNDSDSPGLRIL